MARFYAEIQGDRGLASRMGSAASGIWCHIRGWRIGVRVTVNVDPDDPERDIVKIEKTGGSGYGGPPNGSECIVWSEAKEEPAPLKTLRHHVSGAVARGEKEPIEEVTDG